MNFDDFKYHKSKVPTNVFEKQTFFENLRQQIIDDLETNPKYQPYFKKFSPESVKTFTFRFAESQISMLSGYDYYLTQAQNSKELQYREETETIFKHIKQKKLFNMQLLWRAGNLTLPNIRTTWHFNYWEDHINDCPFLDEITPQEVEAMKQFLLSDASENHHEYSTNWQDYDEFMEKNQEGDYENMPEWYQFYDSYLGTGTLLLLPNTIGQLEEKYRDATRKNQPAPIQNTSTPIQQFPENLFSNIETQAEFVKLFETDPHILYLHKAYTKVFNQYVDEAGSTEYLHDAIEILSQADEPVYMPAGLEWEEAILKCAQQYTHKIIAKELDTVYEEYLMLKEMNIGANNTNVLQLYQKDYLIPDIEKQILNGRKLLGEPQTFDYINL